MQRIQSNDAIHIDGKRMFTEGDAHAEEARGATTITAEFLNTVQEELASFVESQGLELNSKDTSQLSKALGLAINPTIRALNALIKELGTQSGIELKEL